LPDAQHYSSARDLALLTTAMIRDFPEYYPLYSEKEFTYNRIKQLNRNRLLWLDPHVDGVKTGHTKAAGFCLVASAKRGTRRLVAIVLGADSDAIRAREAQKLLNFGFQYYDAATLYAANQPVSELKVYKGAESRVKAGFLSDFAPAVPKGQATKLKVQLISQQPLVAPVSRGSRIGTLKLTLGDQPYGEYPVVALETVPISGMFGRAWDTVRLWFE
jgi:D-alanyl-D-alanine carboxypeptidase (penicillin-binding protein 5/6)